MKETIEVEVTIAATGETFLCEDVSPSITGKEFLSELLISQIINPDQEKVWELLLNSQLIDKSKRFSEFVDSVKKLRIKLVAKCAGA
jgi:hypothetical protein